MFLLKLHTLSSLHNEALGISDETNLCQIFMFGLLQKEGWVLGSPKIHFLI